MVNMPIFMLTFIYLLFNSLIIYLLKSEIFTYCLECDVKRLGQGWIGAKQILMMMMMIIIIDKDFFSFSHLSRTHFHNKGCALSLVLKARVF